MERFRNAGEITNKTLTIRSIASHTPLFPLEGTNTFTKVFVYKLLEFWFKLLYKNSLNYYDHILFEVYFLFMNKSTHTQRNITSFLHNPIPQEIVGGVTHLRIYALD